MTVDGNTTLSRRRIAVAMLTVASTGCLNSPRSEQESRLEVVSVSDDGPVASASVHVDPGILPGLGSLVFTLQLKQHESEWQGSRITLAPPEGNNDSKTGHGDSKAYTPDMDRVSLENSLRVPGTYRVEIVQPNSIEGETVFTQSEIVVDQKTSDTNS